MKITVTACFKIRMKERKEERKKESKKKGRKRKKIVVLSVKGILKFLTILTPLFSSANRF